MSELADQVAAVLKIDPDAPALEFEGHWLSWGELSAMAEELRRLLVIFGPAEGLRVGTVLVNRPFAVGAILCAVLDERCLVTFSGAYPDDRVIEDVSSSQVPVLIVGQRDLDRKGLLEAAAREGMHVIAASEGEGRRASFRVAQAADPSACKNQRNRGVAIEMMTSGTTGRPRRIPLPAANYSRGVLEFVKYESGPPGPRLRSGVSVLTGSFAHIGGLSALLYAMLSGRRACLIERVNVDNALAAIRRHRPKVLRLAPAIVRGLLEAGVSREDLSGLSAIRTGTAPLDPAIVDIFLERFGLPLLQNYGATEFAGGAAGWSLQDFRSFWPAKRGSVGRLSPGVEGRIVDPDSGAVLPVGHDGALEVKARHIGDGTSWMRTTDRASLDEDGFLFLKGRLDNVINRGGFKVAPDEIQRVLESHPNIVEACVLGIADARLGQVPVAVIVLRDPANEPSAAELGSHIKASLPPYAAPVRYFFVQDLPRTPSLKVDNMALRTVIAASSGAGPSG